MEYFFLERKSKFSDSSFLNVNIFWFLSSVNWLPPPRRLCFSVASVCLFVCLSVCKITEKVMNGFRFWWRSGRYRRNARLKRVLVHATAPLGGGLCSPSASSYIWVVDKTLWGSCIGLWETLIDIFHHFMTCYRQNNYLVYQYNNRQINLAN